MTGSAEKMKTVLVNVDGVWRQFKVDAQKGVDIPLVVNSEDAFEKVRRLREEAARPLDMTIHIKGEGSRVLPISEKVNEIKARFNSMSDLKPSLTADFSGVRAGINDVEADMKSKMDSFEAFSQSTAMQMWSSRQASLGSLTIVDDMMRMFERSAYSKNSGGGHSISVENINIQGGGDPSVAARNVRAELLKLNERL